MLKRINSIFLGRSSSSTQGGGSGTGTSNYADLTNKPQINGIALLGNKTGESLGLQKELIPGEGIEILPDGTINLTGGADLTPEQLDAVNSGITAEKVAEYDHNLEEFEQLNGEVATLEAEQQVIKTDLGDLGDQVIENNNVIATKNDIFQVKEVPLLTDIVPNPFQYIGETEGSFIKGHFYEKKETDFTQWQRNDNQTFIVTIADSLVGDGVYQADGKTMIGTITEISDDAMTYTDTDGQSVSTVYHSVFHSAGYEEVYDLEVGAKDITYNNTESGLNASNVQDAIDEVDVKVNETQGDIKDLIDTKNDLSQYDVIKVQSTSPNLIELNKEYIGCLNLATDYNILDIISKNAGLADDTEVVIAKISYMSSNVDYEKILKLRYKVSNTANPYYVLFTDVDGVETEHILFDTRGSSSITIRSINVLSNMAYNFKITEFNSIAELELKDILKADNIQSVFVDGDKDAIIKNFNLNSTNYTTLGVDIAVGNYGPIAVQNGYNPKSQGIIFNLPNGKVLQLSYSDENGLALKPFSTLSSGPNVWGSNLFKFVTLGSDITDMSSLPTGEFTGVLMKIFDVPASASNQPGGVTSGGYCVWSGVGSAGHNQTKCVGTLTFYPLSGGIYFKTFYGWTGSLKASSSWQKIATTTV